MTTVCLRSSHRISTLITLGILTISLAFVSPQYIVNRLDIEHEQPLLFDIEAGTPYKNCGGSNSVIKSVQLNPCDEKSEGHCVLRRGDNVTCSLSFESEENSTTLTAKIFGIIGFVPVPFPCPQVKMF